MRLRTSLSTEVEELRAPPVKLIGRPHLVVMSRFPAPGSVKTRLIPALGVERATELHRAMTCHLLGWVKEFAAREGIGLTLQLAGGAEEAASDPFGFGVAVSKQEEGDLGRRMLGATEERFAEGASGVVIMGTDCPRLTEGTLQRALEALSRCDLVLGPAWDGGYYLIGLRRAIPELFEGIEWSTSSVLDRTLARADEMGLCVKLLEPLGDVDEPADLPRWTMVRKEPIRPIEEEVVSVIVPTLNEEATLAATLAGLARGREVELLVIDAGSQDRTVALAREYGAEVFVCTEGRAAQMNLGASLARGGHLLFLHADTVLPAGYADEVRRILAEGETSAGAFRFGLDDERPVYRWVEWGTNLRSEQLQLPYGDQGLFLKGNTFWRLGGFRSWPLLEDLQLVLELRRLGRVRLSRHVAMTSARRWRKLGLARTLVMNQMILLGFFLGVSPRTLARWYRG